MSRQLGVVIVSILAASAAPAQQVTIGAGSSLSLSNAVVDLGCADLVVAGTLNTDSAAVAQTADFNILGSGTVNGGSGTLDVTGNWTRSGTFNPGTGQVGFVDGCATTTSTLSGATTFNDLVLASSTGKQILFTAGETTTVTGTLTLAGAFNNLLEIRSTVGGSEAFFDLDQTVMGNYVDVKDNHAVDQPIALDPVSVISGNTAGWSVLALVPGLTLLGLGLLGASLYLTGHRTLSRRERLIEAADETEENLRALGYLE